MSGDNYSYGEYVKMMYQKGFYVRPYYINLMSDEVYCIGNKIFIIPFNIEGEDKVYVFTGTSQKATILSGSTKFRLYLEDIDSLEFKDNDNIMLSMIKPNNIVDLYTRNYATWKFGLSFDKGIQLDPDKCLMFQTQKEIQKFEVDIQNIDLFEHKINTEIKDDRMMWLE
jgi:hypothetical protein